MIAARSRVGEISEAPMEEAAPGRVLAVDYGRKRIGVAISDEFRQMAQPLATIERVNRQKDVRRLREICRAREVAHIVVGNPVHMSGESGAMAEEAARFAARLRKELGMPVELYDERLTSWEAEQVIAEVRLPSQRKRGSIDDVAAAVLLRDYLEHTGGGPNARAKKD